MMLLEEFIFLSSFIILWSIVTKLFNADSFVEIYSKTNKGVLVPTMLCLMALQVMNMGIVYTMPSGVYVVLMFIVFAIFIGLWSFFVKNIKALPIAWWGLLGVLQTILTITAYAVLQTI